MQRADHDYLQELMMYLRLAGLDGRAVGAILEETRDHLEVSGETPEDAFGPAETYAAALARSHSATGSTNGMRLTRGDLVAAATQLAGWLLLLPGLASSISGGDVVILPGNLAGWVLLTIALAWPIWPVAKAYLAGRSSITIPIAAMITVLAGSIALTVVWDSLPLVTLRPWVAVLAGAVVIALCWLRVWHLRDPIRRPTNHASNP